jgi:hypothetical protein
MEVPLRPLPLILALALALWATAAAQETTGGVRGRLHSAATGAVPSAQITATSPDLLGERRTRSAADGVFQFALLPPGNYALRVAAIGHRPLVIRDVAVRLGQITGLGDVALEPAAVELGELSITAPTVTLDPVRTTIGATLTTEDLALLPGERDYKSAIAILPHVNTSYHGDPVNAGGSTGLENMYFIDGMNVTSELNAMTGTSLPYNFVRAVEVKAGGYEAQYGKALGAVVNAVTYSGTNDFEGQVFGFFTGNALSATPRSIPTLRESGDVNFDLGARVSGPVARDRLWFSAAYNPRVIRVDKELPGLGVYADKTTTHSFAGKLTWAATPQTNVTLSLFGDPTTRHHVTSPGGLQALNANPLVSREQGGGVTGSLRATIGLTQGLILEGALAYSGGREHRLPENGGDPTEPAYEDDVALTIGGGHGYSIHVREGRATGLLRATLTSGRHALVAGLEYEDARVFREFSVSGITRTDTSVWVSDVEYMKGTFHNRIPTAYGQDAWRVAERLTLSAGLRWSSEFLSGASGETAQRFPAEWQPRLGFSWQLGRQATQRLFGSYGRFYQQIPLNLSVFNYVDYIANLSLYSTDPRQPGAVPYAVIGGTTYEKDYARSIDGIEVENFDEATLGYEHLLGGTNRLTVRGIRRDLRSSFQWGWYLNGQTQIFVIGTPGRGVFSFLPPPKREYTALELALEGTWRRAQYRASYVLARTYGNYTGLYGSDYDAAMPGGNATFMSPWQAVNSTGLLPNDRTHVIKLSGAVRPVPSLALGAFLSVASGIPENDFGGSPIGTQYPPTFLEQRGTVGRTPTVWDLNMRLAYELPWRRPGQCRMVLDLLHVANPRTAVEVDPQHYFAQDTLGRQVNPNPNYLHPTVFQPPMAARLGIEVSF